MRAGKTKGKIAEMRKETEECEVLMKTFCLNPTLATYLRISKCSGVTKGEFYSTWRAMLPHYCTDEGLVESRDDIIKTAEDASAKEKYMAAYNLKRDVVCRSIDAKLSANPTKTGAIQMLYIFAATGWFPILEKFYECIGDSRIGINARTEMSAEYKAWKELYTDRIHELLSMDKNHFTERGIDITAVNFTRFDVYQRDYEEKKKAAAK
jgi:hypothetical protein